MNATNAKAVRYGAILVMLTTLTTFGFAITATPSSGPDCPGNCMDYPFASR